MMMKKRPKLLLFLLALLLRRPVLAEIREFEVLLPPTEAYIHFTDGFIRGPGWIDLSDLTFETIAESSFTGGGGGGNDSDSNPAASGGDNGGDDGGVDGANADGTIDVTDDITDVTPPRRRRARELLLLADDSSSLEQQKRQQHQQNARILDEDDTADSDSDDSIIDIAIFHLPNECASKKNGCDWTTLGVGGKMPDGTSRWCCSQEAIDAGLCQPADFGTFIRQETTTISNNSEATTGVTSFAGNHRYISVPASGPMKKKIKFGRFEEAESGQYVVVFANCNSINGRQVMVRGESVWKSNHGYLPGELFGFMYFYAILTCIYLLLTAWFAIKMKLNVESRIPIEKWILMTIVLGLIEMLARTLDYAQWNVNGYRPYVLVYLGILAGVLKRGISRCLIVMVSLGWGVVRDSLGAAMRAIVILGTAYIGVSVTRDLMLVYAVEDLEKLSYEEEVELFDVVTILTFIVAAIDVIYIMWILDALNGTMQYLENMSQSRKLQRYLTLRSIFLFSILFATIWVVFSLVDTYDEDGIGREEHEWIVDAATEVNYLFVLIGVACLWRPNPSAKEYAYVMELPALGGDGEGETELEMSGVVPSAMDDDDEGASGEKTGATNGFHDDDDEHDKRFQID